MAIKKVFTAVASMLAANMGSTVEDIHEELVALMSAKTGGGGSAATSFHKDDEGNVVALRCSYHQLWFRPTEVEFGAKASSASGFNTMSKDGMSKWTKQLAVFKKAKEQILTDVQNEVIAVSDIAAVTEELEAERATIVAIEGVTGYATLEALLEG